MQYLSIQREQLAWDWLVSLSARLAAPVWRSVRLKSVGAFIQRWELRLVAGRAVKGITLHPLVCGDCGFEFHWSHAGLSLLWMLCVVRWKSVCRADHWYRGVLPTVCCQVEVCVSDWSLVQRSATDCVLSGRGLCVGLITGTEESYRLCVVR